MSWSPIEEIHYTFRGQWFGFYLENTYCLRFSFIKATIFVFKYTLLRTNLPHGKSNINRVVFRVDIYVYPMLRADSRFWLVNNREIWSRISRLTSSAWDIKTKERHWWRHNGDSDRRPFSLPLRYELVTLCLYGDLGQIYVIAVI